LRKDALPEYQVYRDTGCHVHPSCLGDPLRGIPECPLVICVYDEPRAYYRAQVAARAKTTVSLLRDGMTVAGVAQQLGVSRRTVFRYLAIYRDQRQMVAIS